MEEQMAVLGNAARGYRRLRLLLERADIEATEVTSDNIVVSDRLPRKGEQGIVLPIDEILKRLADSSPTDIPFDPDDTTHLFQLGADLGSLAFAAAAFERLLEHVAKFRLTKNTT